MNPDETPETDSDSESQTNIEELCFKIEEVDMTGKPTACPRIIAEIIEHYVAKYINSDLEKEHIKRAYLKGQGSMNFIAQNLLSYKFEDEARIVAIVQKMVDDDEVDKYEEFFNEPDSQKNRRKKKLEQEAKDFANAKGDQ